MNLIMRLCCVASILSACIAIELPELHAADWPQWRGLQRNGISREAGLLDLWPEKADLKVLWKAQVGKGHSAISISQGRAYVLGWDGKNDSLYCLDEQQGRELWKQSYPCREIKQWPGPRSTATVAEGVVYSLGQYGQLRAWNAQNGVLVWQRDLPPEYNPDEDYGFVWSPLIHEDLLILNAGSRGLALRCKDGSIAWGDDRIQGACVSAVPFEHEGQKRVLIVNINRDRSAANLIGVEPRTGQEVFRWEGWKEQWGAMGVDPIVAEGHIFVTSAQQYRQSARFSIRGKSLVQDWTTNRLASYTGSAVLIKSHVYSVDAKGFLKCLDWESGKELWLQRGFDERGSLIAVNDLLIIQTGTSGKLVVVEANPAGYRELRSMTVFTKAPETFTAPVFANGKLFCRSYAGEVVCLGRQ